MLYSYQNLLGGNVKNALIVGIVACGLVCSVLSFRYFNIDKAATIVIPTNVEFVNHNLDIKEINVSDIPNKIWFVKTKNNSFCISIKFKNAGRIRYTKNEESALALAIKTIFEGAGSYSAAELKKILDDNSLFTSIKYDMDDIKVSCYSTAANFHLAMEILKEVMYAAHLSEDKVNVNKQSMQESLEQAKTLPDSIAEDEISKLEYGENSPYYTSIDEQIKYLNACSHDMVKNVYKNMFLPSDAIITVAGNLSEDEVTKEVSMLFIDRDKNSAPRKNIKRQAELANSGSVVHKQTKDQQIVVKFSHPAIDCINEDIYALEMGLHILAKGMTARLFKSIREKQGLTYSIRCMLEENQVLSTISGSAITSPDKCDKLITSVKEQLEAIKNVTQEELDAHKIALMASDVLTSSQDIVRYLVLCRDRRCPISKVNSYMQRYYSLKVDDINRVMQKYISAEKMAFVTVGDKK